MKQKIINGVVDCDYQIRVRGTRCCDREWGNCFYQLTSRLLYENDYCIVCSAPKVVTTKKFK